MKSDVYDKSKLPPEMVELIESGLIRPDGTYIGFDILPEIDFFHDGTKSIDDKE